jgi:hypothetical protein
LTDDSPAPDVDGEVGVALVAPEGAACANCESAKVEHRLAAESQHFG